MRIVTALVLSLFLALGVTGASASGLPEMVVYKSPTCGCCASWVDRMQDAGFKVTIVERTEVNPIKQQFGVPPRLASCHTALVGGYVVEGHVPATAVKRLLDEKPSVLGVAVPGMPVGSPGMEGPNPQPFRVELFDERGSSRVFESYRPPYHW